MVKLACRDLSVGYGKRALLRNVCVELSPGEIICVLGPNGAGKSTLLRTLSRHIAAMGGRVEVLGRDLAAWPRGELARVLSVLLTERIHPERMTGLDVVAMGRYPYTNVFGHLTAQDRARALEAMRDVEAECLTDTEYVTMSDGQKQRVLIARALCQDPEVLLLDEPTAYLDIRYKMSLLQLLRRLCRTRGLGVIVSLHEMDLAIKCADRLVCIDEKGQVTVGTPEELGAAARMEALFALPAGSFQAAFGCVEPGRLASAADGHISCFVLGGGGLASATYRALARREAYFATGVLYTNDVDYVVAAALGAELYEAPAFAAVPDAVLESAQRAVARSGTLLCPEGTKNLHAANRALYTWAKAQGVTCIDRVELL